MGKKTMLFRDLKLRLDYEEACTWFFVLYMVSGLVRTITYAVLAKVGMGSLYVYAAIAVIYLTMLVYVLWNLFKNGKIEKRIAIFLLMFLLIALYFWITLMINPNYGEYYSKPFFGAYEAVFRPDSGALFGLLAVLVSQNTGRLRHNLRYTMPPLLLYTVYQFYQYTVNGYWLIYDYTGEQVEQSYNLGFGYTAIFCAMVLISFFWEERKVWQISGAVLAIILAILGGSRGCLLSFAVFIAILLVKKFEEFSFRKKLLIVVGIAVIYLALSNSYDAILSMFTNVGSRTISMFLEGTFTSDNGRNNIYKLAWEAIAKMPFWGYGAYGDRFFIAPHYYWGYCHHIALEFIIDFGWMIGVALLALIALNCLRVLLKASGEQVMIVAVLFGANVKLFLSDSFWAYPEFWMLIGYVFFVMENIKKHRIMRRRG